VTTLTVLAGAPGSGKSTYAAARWSGDQIVSSDQIRAKIGVSPGERAVTFRLFHSAIALRLARGLSAVADATSARPEHRAELLAIAREWGATAVLIVMNTPVEMCVANNAVREDRRRVPEDDVRRMHAAIRADLPGITGESFDAVYLVSSGKTVQAGG
jgi:protein phosphatase